MPRAVGLMQLCLLRIPSSLPLRKGGRSNSEWRRLLSGRFGPVHGVHCQKHQRCQGYSSQGLVH